MPDESPILTDALLSPDAYPHATSDIRQIETHISRVFLTGQFAYKIKKPVRLPFLDFSTLERRRHFCEHEVRLNRRLAPEIYRDVVPIGGSASHPRIGATPALEYAVRMCQFGVEDTADRMLACGRLSPEALTGLAQRLASFHASLEPAYDSFDDTIETNLGELQSLPGAAGYPGFEALADSLRDLMQARQADRERRRLEGCVRECHGDLHLANLAWIEPDLIPFDCLEFDRQLRTIDRIDELAFLFMDLSAHQRQDLGFVLLNRYLEIAGDYPGVLLLRLYATHRALVRAKVALLAQEQATTADERACRYLDSAQKLGNAGRPTLLLTCGFSGSGKSTIASSLAPLLGTVHVRSDIERKRLFGRAVTARAREGVGQGMYSPDATAATYASLLRAAEAALRGRVGITVDASFLSAARRQAFAALARECDARFLILHCTASKLTLQQRIQQRARQNADPSDADLAVLERQIQQADVFSEAESSHVLGIDTEKTADTRQLAARIAELTQVSLSSTSY